MTSRGYFGKMNSTLGSVVPLAMFLKEIPQEIVDMFSDAWYWVTMDEWTR